MIDEKTAQDIQAEVDGENMPEESARVRALIARDREAAALYGELKELSEALAVLPAEEPPGDLRRVVEGSAAWRGRVQEIRDRRQLPAGPAGTSTDSNMKEGIVKGKYVIAGLAAAGIAGLVYFGGFAFPPKSDEAAGTIGAVKKHRVEQISEGDVVLGTTPADVAWVPFADLVGDAGAIGSFSTRLEAISRDLAAKATTLEAKDTLAAKAAVADLNAISASLEARATQLQARAFDAATLQAKDLSALAAKVNLGANATLDAKSFTLAAKNLSEQLQARQIDLAGASAKLNALTSELAAAMRLDARTLQAAPSLEARTLQAAPTLDARTLQAAPTLDARTLEAASRLGALAKSLEAKSTTLDAKSFQADLGAISAALEARTAELAARTLAARDSYIGMAASAHADLVGARTMLGALASQLEASSKLEAKSFDALNARATELNARAAELEQGGLVGMRGQLDLAAKNHDALMGMTDSLESASRSLGVRNADLQARDALAAFSKELGAKSVDAASFLGAACRNDLGAVDRALGAREAVFGAKTLEAMSAHLGALSSTLESRSTQLGAKDIQGLESQLGSVSRTLQARTPDAQ